MNCKNNMDKDEQIFLLKIVNIFLSFDLNICFECSKEPSQWDSFSDHPQHNVLIEKYENSFITKKVLFAITYILPPLHM